MGGNKIKNWLKSCFWSKILQNFQLYGANSTFSVILNKISGARKDHCMTKRSFFYYLYVPKFSIPIGHPGSRYQRIFFLWYRNPNPKKCGGDNFYYKVAPARWPCPMAKHILITYVQSPAGTWGRFLISLFFVSTLNAKIISPISHNLIVPLFW